MKSIKFTYSLLFIASITLTAFYTIDTDFLQRLTTQLKTYTKLHPEEKVYLQFDKPFYKPGEDIWFNVFLLDGTTHRTSGVSDVVYVELKDPKGNTVHTLTLFVNDGTAKGDFKLEASGLGGLYTVIAYTRWMKNSGEESFFKKELPVQKIITPRMLLKLDFEKEAYGRGDEVSAMLTASTLRNESVENSQVQTTVRINGAVVTTKDYVTDQLGKTVIRFNLPETLNTTDGLLQVVISAAGLEESISRSIPIVLNNINIKFYPEGGDIVSGISGKVAFKATNEFGKGADISGVIVDESNSIVTSFSSFHMGMGAFTFTPVQGKIYSAKIDKPAGNTTLFKLPVPILTGYAFGITKEIKQNVIHCSVNSPIQDDAFLIGHVHGEIHYAEKLNLKKGENNIPVDVDGFPAGIAVFTLFNSGGQEEAERLVFLNAGKTLKIHIKTNKKTYQPREKVEVSIHTEDDTGKPQSAKLSLGVVDDQLISFADDKQDNMLSWVFLSAELKGKIQEPSFYFDPNEPTATEAMDYLMLTHGWRRFTWKDVFKNNKEVAWLPENNSTIFGMALNKENKTTKTEVVLMELGQRKRLAKVQTTDSGQFSFKNVDASASILLLTRKPNHLRLPEKTSLSVTSIYTGENSVGYESQPALGTTVDNVSIPTPSPLNIQENGMDLTLDEDIQSLQEVIVIGYGQQRRNDITSAITTVHSNMLETIPSFSLEQVLQGRVAGLDIQRQNSSPGSASGIRIRGMSSITARNEPLYVIDGFPLAGNLNSNFSNGNLLSPGNIESITILKGPEATAFFGSAGANGVILINTKSRLNHFSLQTRKRKAKYSNLLITPRQFSATREFYADVPGKKTGETRKDFRTTVYWNHTVITDKNGNATLSFNTSDAVSAFRITAEGLNGTGLIGRSEEVYAAELPFSIDTKIPEFMGFEDTLRLPVMIKNTLSTPLEATLSIDVPAGLKALSKTTLPVTVDAMKTKTYWIPLTSESLTGNFRVKIKLEGKKYSDEVTQMISVHPVGFPVRLSFSGKDLERSIEFNVENMERGSMHGEVTAYTDILADLFSGVTSILRAPHGCFEQVSSSTFPNILALQFLKESGQLRPDMETLALNYIRSGYKQLAAYEITGGGFEWFGHPPAHEALSAYGLIEFNEMKKVFGGVDEKMVRRTQEWILSRRKGDGTFLQNSGKYGFSSASKTVTNAYLVYALAETGTKDIDKEYAYSLTEAWQSNDMYRMALMANAAYSLHKINDYEKLVNEFIRKANESGLEKLTMDHSAVRSYGNSLAIETVSLWGVAMLRAQQPDFISITRCIDFILAKRSFGMFGSTQSTTLALKALTLYAASINSKRDDGEVTVSTNNVLTDTQHYTKETKNSIVMNKFTGLLGNGKNSVRVKFNTTTEALPYSINLTWNSKVPLTDTACKMAIETKLAQRTVKVNETVRLTTILSNKTHQGVPMSVALIGIPAGLSLQPWQLKELQEKKVFDFYEVMGNRLAIYYRELEPRATRTINLDLKAEAPGSFSSVASCVYLYYTDEYKGWVKGNTIRIY
jgi:TonB-dependent SusC/RagA subfamily outer membrane receptor